MKRFRLHKKIKDLIKKQKIKLHVSHSVKDMDADLENDSCLQSIHGLFVYEPNQVSNKPGEIWLRPTHSCINYNALHEFGHYLTMKEYQHQTLNSMDETTKSHAEELLAEGAAIALSYMLDLKIKKKSMSELRTIIKGLKIIKKKT